MDLFHKQIGPKRLRFRPFDGIDWGIPETEETP